MESLNGAEEQASTINVEEQAQITIIHALEQDISSAKSSTQDITDEADQMLKRTVGLDKQKLISSKDSERASLVRTLNLMQQERISVSAKLLQKRLYNSKLREEMDSKLQLDLGSHDSNWNLVKNIRIGMPIFLYNFCEKKLYGGFISISTGTYNLDGFAFKKHSAVSKFPSQVRVESNHIYPALDKEEFRGVVQTLKDNVNHFSFELDVDQTESLIELFVEKEMLLV